MADQEAAAQDDEPDTQAIAADDTSDIEVKAKSPSKKAVVEAVPESLPIEGESKWVTTMRVLAFATLGALIVIGGIFHFLAGNNSFLESQQIGLILGGLVFMLVLEYFIFLRVVIPRQADYGRYVIHQDKVEFYPLTAMGLGIKPRSKAERMSKFLGITTGIVRNKKGVASFGVYLVHTTDKGKTINIHTFPDLKEAEQFAMKLGKLLQLNVVSGARQQAAKHKKRAV